MQRTKRLHVQRVWLTEIMVEDQATGMVESLRLVPDMSDDERRELTAKLEQAIRSTVTEYIDDEPPRVLSVTEVVDNELAYRFSDEPVYRLDFDEQGQARAA